MDKVDMDKYRGWLTKQEAAVRLQRSPKYVQRQAAANRIGSVAVRDPHAPGGQKWLYDPADVDDLARQGQPAIRPTVFLPDQASNGNGHHADHAIASRAALALPPDPAVAQAAAIATVVRLVSTQVSTLSIQFLTLAEASAETGLSQAYLRRQIEDGKLPAVRDRGWRIRRRDLEAL